MLSVSCRNCPGFCSISPRRFGTLRAVFGTGNTHELRKRKRKRFGICCAAEYPGISFFCLKCTPYSCYHGLIRASYIFLLRQPLASVFTRCLLCLEIRASTKLLHPSFPTTTHLSVLSRPAYMLSLLSRTLMISFNFAPYSSPVFLHNFRAPILWRVFCFSHFSFTLSRVSVNGKGKSSQPQPWPSFPLLPILGDLPLTYFHSEKKILPEKL